MNIRLAAPSCVYPDRLGHNCHALATQVREVALMLLETQGCLEYDHRDLPDLPALGLTYHVHLPVDLPWDLGPRAVGDVVRQLCSRVAFLRPMVLCAAPAEPEMLDDFLAICPELRTRLLLENTRDNDLAAVWPLIERHDLGVCLDLGHLRSYEQEPMLGYPHFFAHVRLLHIYGGESSSGHAGLHALPRPEWLRDVLTHVNRDCVAVVELFDPAVFTHSLELLLRFLAGPVGHRP